MTARLAQIGDADGWRCWICDEPVDPQMSVNDARGPSVDSLTAKGRTGDERLAHRGCNTKKGAVKAVIPWPASLFVVDPAPIIAAADHLQRRGGRQIMARCPSAADAGAAATWLVDRLSRLRPGLGVAASVESGGGQFLVVLSAAP